jgi:hypothetical protein
MTNGDPPGDKCPLCGGRLVVEKGWDCEPLTDVMTPGEFQRCSNCGAHEGYRGCWILSGRVVKPRPK